MPSLFANFIVDLWHIFFTVHLFPYFIIQGVIEHGLKLLQSQE